MIHPYWGKTFFPFFKALFFHLGRGPLVTDELQLCVLLTVGISAALLGTFLIHRRMTMLASSLSHTLLLGIVVTYVLFPGALGLPQLLFAALLTGLLTAFSTDILTRRCRLQEDASIGLVFSGFFALGLLLITLYTRSSHIGIEAVMGNIDALHVDDLRLGLALLLGNLALLALLYRPLVVSTFDPTFAKAIGLPTLLLNYALMVQTSATAIGSFRAIGVFLFLAFLVGPPLIARRYTRRLVPQLLVSAAVVVLASLLAVALSRHMLSAHYIPLSTSGLAVTLLGLLFFLPKKGLRVRMPAPKQP